jgi:hypothetical protein
LLVELAETCLQNCNYNDPHLMIQFASNLHLLQKLLVNKFVDEKLSFKKELVDTLKTLKFELCFYKTWLYIHINDYETAEIFANKALNDVNYICPSERSTLRCYILVTLAFIKAQQDDPESVILYLKDVFKGMLQIKDQKLFLANSVNRTYLSQACEYAGTYFLKKNQVDFTIKYFQMAMEYSVDICATQQLNKKLHALAPQLTNHVFSIVKEKDYHSMLSNVKVYPDHHLIYFYFEAEKYALISKKHLLKNNINFKEFKKDEAKTEIYGFAIELAYDFECEIFLAILDTVRQIIHKDKRNELKNLKADNQVIIKNEKEEVQPLKDVEYAKHPKAYSSAGKKKKASRVESTVQAIPRISRSLFFDRIQQSPLPIVIFNKYGKVFDPKNPNGVVTLRVNDMSGKWFACINPGLIKLLSGNKEFAKIANRFEKEIEVGNDCCVPCLKEMKTKGSNTSGELPYLFKIRLLGKGNGNIRVYAKLIEVTVDNKKLVAFTAINFNSHTKGSRPEELPMLIDFLENEMERSEALTNKVSNRIIP